MKTFKEDRHFLHNEFLKMSLPDETSSQPEPTFNTLKNSDTSDKDIDNNNNNTNLDDTNDITQIKDPLLFDSDSSHDTTHDNEYKYLPSYSSEFSIHFQIISSRTVSIEFQPEECLTPVLKETLTNNGAYCDERLGLWLIPFKKYSLLYTLLASITRGYSLIKIPKIAFKAYEDATYTSLIFNINNKEYIIDYASDSEHKKTINDLPKKLKANLYPFQKEGIQFGLDHHCRFLIADEMGVGKTIQAIALCHLYKENWPVLVICPGSVKYNWKNEMMRWLNVKPSSIAIINKSKQKIHKAIQVYIISYDMARRVHRKLSSLTNGILILDECQSIKNKDALRTKCILPIAKITKRLILLSGTPILSRPLEGYTILSCLRPDIFYNFYPYGERYCNPILTKFGVNWSGASNTKELHFIFKSLMIRRLKKEVLHQLPPKRRTKFEIECDKAIVTRIKNHYTKKKEHRLSMAEIYKLTGLAKMKGITAYIKDLIEAEVKFLIFAHHHVVMNAIERVLIQHKVGYIRIDGNVNGQERFNLVERFQTNEDCMVALLSINAASTGITLTAASLVVFAELTWTPAVMIQAEDRVHRIGQEDSRVDVYYLYGKDTLDEYIFSKLDQKLIIVSTTLDDKRERMGLKDKLQKGSEHKKKAIQSSTQLTDENSHNDDGNVSNNGSSSDGDEEQSTNLNDSVSGSTGVDVFEKNNHVRSAKREHEPNDSDGDNESTSNENINDNMPYHTYKQDKRYIIN